MIDDVMAERRRPVAVRPARRVPYAPERPLLVRAEVQPLDRSHPAVGYGPHAHDFFEIVVFTAPGGVHRVQGIAEPVRRGDVWLLAPGVHHDLAGIGAARGWVVVAGYDVLGLPMGVRDVAPWPMSPLVRAFQQTDSAGRPRPLSLDDEELRRWSGWLSDMARECAELRPGYEEVVEALLRILLVDAGRLTPAPAAPPRVDTLVDRALELVGERFADRLSLSDVASELAVTPGHLTEVVRRQTGRPLGEWILERRIAQARMLLAGTTRPIGAVSAACGFQDVGHFSRQFRRRHGMSPSVWRAAVTGTTCEA
ncbi:AraC family transcriptional regulator [Streptomyces sp. NPDC047108]|uniref:AraC family transcriptional regulator n=1 Tax=Streptomyces sp. NPDC047108 TaxID=3155025 RepID=UPI0033D8B22C